MNQPADYQQRITALDPSRSFAVAAPAGSGKTGLLTQRVLTLLASCQHPEEILSITFTRKAAAEMRHRIVSALQQAQSPTPPDDDYQRHTWQLARTVLARDAELNWQLLAAPNRLRIQTIDGLCRDLARQLVLENGLGELPQQADNPDAFYREAVQGLLTELESDDCSSGSTAEALATLLRHLDNNMQRLENLFAGLLSKREQWLGHIVDIKSLSLRDARPYLEHQLQQIAEETLQNVLDKLQPYASDLAILVDYAATNLSQSQPDHSLCQLQGLTELPPAHHECTTPWQAILGLLFTKDGTWRKTIDVRSGFPAGKGEPKARKDAMLELIGQLKELPGLEPLLQDIRTLPYGEYPQRQWAVLAALTNLLPQLSAQLSLVFLRNNACDFTEITLAALRALGHEDAPTDTALRLDYAIRHILIDEFQDTSSNQFQLLRKLTAGWEPDDGRTLFIVGDGMQSLYGFRSANVGLFLEARRHPIGNVQLQPLDLSVNFRSQSKLVQWVNEKFKVAFPAEDNTARGAVRYSDASAFNREQPDHAVLIDAIVDADNRQREAELVVEKIHSAQQHNPEGSIAILVRNRGHLRDILPALYQAGLNWQAIDIEPLSQKMAVIDIHSLTRALLSPADRIAWLSILRAPWCGLDLHDLHCLSNNEIANNPIPEREHYPLLPQQLLSHEQFAGLSCDGQTILNRVAPILLEGLQQKGRKPLRSWIEGIWIALGGPAALLDGNDLQHVRRYFDLLEQHSATGNIDDWAAFTNAVDHLYAAPATDSNSNLQVMTIHKSKGLEFDTVIIPGLDKATAGNDSEMLLWRERVDPTGEAQLLLGPLQASGDDKDALFEHLKHEAKQKSLLENTRVIYVGATRAINKLHLLFQLKSGNRDNYRAPAENSLLAPLWPALESQLMSQAAGYTLHYPPQPDEQDNSQPVSLSHHARLPANWQPAAIADNPLLTSYRGRAEGYRDNSDVQQDNPTARHTGTVLHRTLQQIVSDSVDHWGEKRVDRQQPFWHSQLQQLGVTDTGQAVDILTRAVLQICSDKKGRWLLDSKHTDSRCELPLAYFDRHGKQRTAIVDRTFVDNGTRWIIDYKSSQPAHGQSLEHFIQQQCDHYRPQLQRYGKLFQQMEQQPIGLALYFPLLSHWVEIEPG